MYEITNFMVKPPIQNGTDETEFSASPVTRSSSVTFLEWSFERPILSKNGHSSA